MFPAHPDWPDGLELFIYDDGRVKIGGWHAAATVEAVPTFASITGNDGRGGSHVIAWFAAAVPAPDAVPERARTPSCAYLISWARGANLGGADAAKVTCGGAAEAGPAESNAPGHPGRGQRPTVISRCGHCPRC